MQHHLWRIDTHKKSQRSKLKTQSFGKLRIDPERSRTGQKLEWEKDPEIKKNLRELIRVLDFPHIDLSRIFCFRTRGSKSRSYARIWSFPKVFQIALDIKPAYVIEVLSRHFDKLDNDAKKKVLIHELLHIPKNFSGALLPHRGRSRHIGRLADKLFKEYKKQTR